MMFFTIKYIASVTIKKKETTALIQSLRKGPMRIEKPLTTGDIAKYCHVTHVGVVKWIKSGKLKAYATPGGHYRIEKKDFKYFLTSYKMPIHEEYFHKDNPRILIVDDHAADVDLVTRHLLEQNPNYGIESASDGYEAGLKVGVFRPNLVILDLVMPRVDGFEVCRRIKRGEKTKHIKVLAMTAHRNNQKYLEDILQCGAEACFTKPIDFAAFLKQVKKLLSRIHSVEPVLMAE